MKSTPARGAHNVRTDAPSSSRRIRHNAACGSRPDMRFLTVPAVKPRSWHDAKDTANAVWVHAHPGFKSPSLRRSKPLPGMSW